MAIYIDDDYMYNIDYILYAHKHIEEHVYKFLEQEGYVSIEEFHLNSNSHILDITSYCLLVNMNDNDTYDFFEILGFPLDDDINLFSYYRCVDNITCDW